MGVAVGLSTRGLHNQCHNQGYCSELGCQDVYCTTQTLYDCTSGRGYTSLANGRLVEQSKPIQTQEIYRRATLSWPALQDGIYGCGFSVFWNAPLRLCVIITHAAFSYRDSNSFFKHGEKVAYQQCWGPRRRKEEKSVVPMSPFLWDHMLTDTLRRNKRCVCVFLPL